MVFQNHLEIDRKSFSKASPNSHALAFASDTAAAVVFSPAGTCLLNKMSPMPSRLRMPFSSAQQPPFPLESTNGSLGWRQDMHWQLLTATSCSRLHNRDFVQGPFRLYVASLLPDMGKALSVVRVVILLDILFCQTFPADPGSFPPI